MERIDEHMSAAIYLGLALRGAEDDGGEIEATRYMFSGAKSQYFGAVGADDRPILFLITKTDGDVRDRPGGLLLTEQKLVHVELSVGFFKTKLLPTTIIRYEDLRTKALVKDPRPVPGRGWFWAEIGSSEQGAWKTRVLDSSKLEVSMMAQGIISGAAVAEFDESGIESLEFKDPTS